MIPLLVPSNPLCVTVYHSVTGLSSDLRLLKSSVFSDRIDEDKKDREITLLPEPILIGVCSLYHWFGDRV